MPDDSVEEIRTATNFACHSVRAVALVLAARSVAYYTRFQAQEVFLLNIYLR